ncbi:MAG: EAL domain-containing protein [Steroidobacteraceae bacterium]
MRLQAEQVGQLCHVLPLSLGTSLVLALIAVVILWHHANHVALLAWLGTLLVVSGGRLRIYRQHIQLRTAPAAQVLELAPRVRVGSALAGVSWGLAIVLLYAPGDLAYQLFLVFVLAGVTAGSATSMAADRRVALYFQLPILVPLALRLAVDFDGIHFGMSAMVLLYTAFLFMSVQRLSSQTVANIELRLQALQREQQLFESETRYRQLASHDALTGLPNRLALQGDLPALLAGAAQSGGRAALLYLDLDDFKDVNDSRGHASGDHVLVEVAARLRACVRAGDLVARMGGDEFIVATANARCREDIEQFAMRIRGAFAVPLQLGGELLNTRVSIGIGIYPDDGADAALLMRHADTALYQAKARGRGGIQFYDAGMSAAVAERLYMEHALLQALDAGALHVEYQPLVSLPTGTITGLEALARWRHPERGNISPATFIAIAEQCGQIERLGEQVLRQVSRQLRQWQDEMLPTIPVAINVAPRQLEYGHFVDLVASVTADCGIDPSLLQVEITESTLMGHDGEQFAALQALRRMGARVSIDDFGTGYSSLSYLKHLPIDCVKIDRSFVRDMQGDERDAAIVSAIVNIAHSLGLRVIAEGVETAHQADRLAALGCDAAQGYHFHKPLSAQQCRDLLVQLAQQRPASDTLRLRIQRWMRPRERLA